MSRFKSLLLCAAMLGSLFGFGHAGAAFAEPAAPQSPEQRVALVIGNSKYERAPQLANPENDAQSMAKFLNSAGFEVISATDLTQSDMLKVMQDFSAKIAERGPNTVAMIYYAGHGVQLAGENYLVPVDAKISEPEDLVRNSVRLVDVMATLDAIPSRMRIVLLDACRNNPFPTINDAGRGLAIVDAPNGSIVGYSTAPGTEALDGTGNHSPYAEAFLKVAGERNLPIEQLFKRVRLEVNNSTGGQQVPWESSSLTSDFYFFGDTAVAASQPPSKAPVVQMASNLPSRSARQAYDYVLSEGSPEYYQEFITLYPHDPLCDRIRWLLRNLQQAKAWHKAVLANSPFAYKTFYENYSNSPYAKVALMLQSEQKKVPLLQATKLIVPQQLAPKLKLTNFGQPKDSLGIKLGDTNGQASGGKLGIVLGDKPQNDLDSKNLDSKNFGDKNSGGKIVTLPPAITPKPLTTTVPTKIVTLPAPNGSNATNGGTPGKIVTMPPVTVGKPGTATTTTTTNGGAGKILTLPGSKVGKAETSNTATTSKRIVDGPVLSRPLVRNTNTGVIKLNNNPVEVKRTPITTGKMSGVANSNPKAAFAQTNGQGRRGFMR